MSRIPAGLLYLAIYNPTLRPKEPYDHSDEDAEEQAHILFYTSKEHAVSRDRMLRQVGLAKALVNFSELFNPNDRCESIHSQTRRMVVVSPEPNFWINAAVELPKTLQKAAQSKGSSSKSKIKSKADSQEVYDYEEGTVHDGALRRRLMHSYEKFKLRHGSFTSVLEELGQEALELQLERFFTVWAWSWNLEENPSLSKELGLPLQPYSNALIPILDSYSANLPESVIPFILSRTHILPSRRYVARDLPSALAEHLMTMIPPAPPPQEDEDDPLAASVATIQARPDQPEESKQTGLFGLPAVTVNMPKWNWQGYLSFGKSSGSNAAKEVEAKQEEPSKIEKANNDEGTDAATLKSNETEQQPSSPDDSNNVDVDSGALEEALSTERRLPPLETSTLAPASETDDEDRTPLIERSRSVEYSLAVDDVSSSPQSSMTILPRRVNRSPSPPPLPAFSVCQVHLAEEGSIMTKRRDVHYYTRNGMMLALLGVDESDQPDFAEDVLSTAARNATQLLDDIELTEQNAGLSKLSESLPSATKILQTPDQYAISTEQFVTQSAEWKGDSSHLWSGVRLLERDPDILEVFMRGQNPQHWHVVKRGLSSHSESPSSETGPSSSAARGNAFLEVFRKEASLPDVDNVLAGILRRSGVGESGLLL